MRADATKDYVVYLFASLIFLAGLFGVYDDVAVSAGGRTPGGAKQESLTQLPAPFPGVSRLHLVLIGADERPHDVGRSDTLMVMWLNPQLKKAAIMSIPRDLKTEIPGHSATKINAAFAFGGAPLTRATVESLLGLKTDGYLKVNFEGFCKAVDTLGGVDVIVPDVEGEGRGMNYDDNWGNLHVHLTPGKHHLNGYEAMGFCRYRKSNIHGLGDGDGGRAARQQQFIKAMVEQKLKVTNLPGLLAAGRQISSCIETNFTWRQCVDLARLLREMGPSDIKTLTVPVNDNMEGGVWFSHLAEGAFREMLTQIDQHLDSVKSAVCDVDVYNGSGVAGLGKAAAEQLTQAGFKVIKTQTAPSRSHDATRIRYEPGNQSLALAAAAALGVGKPEPAPIVDRSSLPNVPIEIIVGQDYEKIAGTDTTLPATAVPARRDDTGRSPESN